MSSREHAGADSDPTAARDPRAEAQRVVGPALEARVLEPSPPAVNDEWFADDPVSGRAPATGMPTDHGGRAVVAPVAGPWTTWDEWLGDRAELEPWIASRWLGAFPRLPAAPPALTATRRSLHRLAVSVLAPARRRANGKIGLRYTWRGFGTPFFGDDEQVRVAGLQVVRQRSGGAVARAITTVADAADLVLEGPPDTSWAAGLDVPEIGDPDAPLDVDATAAGFLTHWYGFGFSVLEALRAEPASSDPSRVQLWPEHFDAAFDCLPEASGRRATFGFSPGDDAVDDPYLYVTPWSDDAPTTGPLWNATSFRGAILPWGELAGVDDQRASALEFLRRRRDALVERARAPGSDAR